MGKDFWWTYSGPLNNVAAGANLQAGPGPTVSFDMTKPVAEWAAAGDQSDYGFVFSNLLADARGAQPAAQNLACFSRYYTAQLKVVYF